MREEQSNRIQPEWNFETKGGEKFEKKTQLQEAIRSQLLAPKTLGRRFLFLLEQFEFHRSSISNCEKFGFATKKTKKKMKRTQFITNKVI